MGVPSWNSSPQVIYLVIMAKADPYAGIEFEEINEATGLENDEIKCLKTCFDLFDSKKVEFLSADDLDEILRAMGFRPSKEELQEILKEIDEDVSGEIEFVEFCQLCAKFLVEDPDIETMKRELKDAFRIYDKEGQGYITTETSVVSSVNSSPPSPTTSSTVSSRNSTRTVPELWTLTSSVK